MGLGISRALGFRVLASGFRVDPGYARRSGGSSSMEGYSQPKALRTHNLRLLGPKTILEKALGLF